MIIPPDVYAELIFSEAGKCFVEAAIKEFSICKKWFEKNIPLR